MDYKSMLIYAALLVAFIAAGRIVTKWISAPKGPKQTVSARVLKKERGPETDEQGNPWLFVVFQLLPSQEELRLHVKARVFRELPEDQRGTLTYAGEDFLSFDSQGTVITR